MSWVADGSLNVWHKIAIHVIKQREIPNHVAFIMDGNRRFATKTALRTAEGHYRGFDTLTHVLEWCLKLGIREVSVYAFALENFKRNPDEVKALMELAAEKFAKLLTENRDRLTREGVCIRVFGELHLLSPELKSLIAQTVLLTKNNCNTILNVAFAYSARTELSTALKAVISGIADGSVSTTDIDIDLIDQCLYTNLSQYPIDMIVRTSGEQRLSDFLLWQSGSAFICFTHALWPEFTVWNFLKCIFDYQTNLKQLTVLETSLKCDRTVERFERNARIQNFINNLHKRRLELLQSYV